MYRIYKRYIAQSGRWGLYPRLTHGGVRTVRTAQNLHNADIHWAERAVEVDTEPKLCIAGRLNQNCGHRASIMIVCDGLRTSVGYGDSTTSRRRIDTPRNAPSGAAAERALLFARRSTSFGRSPRLVPRSGCRLAPLKEPKRRERTALSHCTGAYLRLGSISGVHDAA